MDFTVELQPAEYRRAMVWHHYAGTVAKRVNTAIAWSILLLTPVSITLLWLLAPEALSIWYGALGVLAVLYALYSIVGVRYQIGKQADTMPQSHPALIRTDYAVHAKGVKLVHGGPGDGEPAQSIFFPWREIERVVEIHDLFLIFVDAERLLIVPQRSVPDVARLRQIMREAIVVNTMGETASTQRAQRRRKE